MSKIQEIVVVVFMILAFLLGYGFRNAQVTSTTTQTAETETGHVVETTTTSKQPNGDVKVVRTVDSTTKTKINEKNETKAVKSNGSGVTVSALGGYDFSKPKALTPLYGVSVTKQVLGPITIGAFGLTNGVLGLSLGYSF